MPAIDEIVKSNKRWADARVGGADDAPPKRDVAIVTCMDARIMPETQFGLDEGDAHVIRNAGGRTAEAIRSLAISQHLAGISEVMVVHHTDCALNHDEGELRSKVEDGLGDEVPDTEFLTFDDLKQSVRDDVQLLTDSDLLDAGSLTIRGFVYDVDTGALDEVDEA